MMAVMAIFFGGLGAVMAYLISYEEYVRHFSDRRRARKMALQTAAVTLGFFTGIGIVLAVLLPHLLG